MYVCAGRIGGAETDKASRGFQEIDIPSHDPGVNAANPRLLTL